MVAPEDQPLIRSLFLPLAQRDSEKLAADMGLACFAVAATGQKVAGLPSLVPASCWGPGGVGVCSVEQAEPPQRLDNSEPQKAFL